MGHFLEREGFYLILEPGQFLYVTLRDNVGALAHNLTELHKSGPQILKGIPQFFGIFQVFRILIAGTSPVAYIVPLDFPVEKTEQVIPEKNPQDFQIPLDFPVTFEGQLNNSLTILHNINSIALYLNVRD